MPAGRPSEKPEAVKKLEEAFAMDCDVSEACLFANISRTTYYEWIKEDKELADRFEELRNEPFLKARKTIIDNLHNEETAKWYLERKKKKEFAARTELTGDEGKDLIISWQNEQRDNNSVQPTQLPEGNPQQ